MKNYNICLRPCNLIFAFQLSKNGLKVILFRKNINKTIYSIVRYKSLISK